MDLKTWRTSKGLTQKEVAAMLGITDVTVCRYEAGTRKNMSNSIVEKIFTITEGQVTPNDLYGIK